MERICQWCIGSWAYIISGYQMVRFLKNFLLSLRCCRIHMYIYRIYIIYMYFIIYMKISYVYIHSIYRMKFLNRFPWRFCWNLAVRCWCYRVHEISLRFFSSKRCRYIQFALIFHLNDKLQFRFGCNIWVLLSIFFDFWCFAFSVAISFWFSFGFIFFFRFSVLGLPSFS